MNEDKMTVFYQCDAELFKDCKKTHCQKECTLTTFKEYAKTDEFRNPIIAIIDNKEPRPKVGEWLKCVEMRDPTPQEKRIN